MVNYLNGKVYRIVCNVTGKQYIGSTVSPLATRLSQHKKLFKDGKSGTSKIVLECKDFEIFLLERFSCDTKEELLARERYYIETVDCVNKKIPLRTQAEWYEDNRERLIAHQMVWNNNNRDKLAIYQKKYRNKNKAVNVIRDESIIILDEELISDDLLELKMEDIYEATL